MKYLNQPFALFLSKLYYKFYFVFYPRRPWINKYAFNKLNSIINKNSVIAEYGAGKSTLFFAENSLRVYSIESSMVWFESIKVQLESFTNVILFHADREKLSLKSYASSLDNVCSEQLDILFIDAYERNLCIESQWSKVKLGGYLIIDDYHRYFTFKSKYGDYLSKETTRPDYRVCERILSSYFNLKIYESGGFSTAFCKRIK